MPEWIPPDDSHLLAPAFLEYLRRDSPLQPLSEVPDPWQPAVTVARRLVVAGVTGDLDDRPGLVSELATAWEIVSSAMATRQLGLSMSLVSDAGRLSCTYGAIGGPADTAPVLAQALDTAVDAGIPRAETLEISAGSGKPDDGWVGALAVGTPFRIDDDDPVGDSIADKLLLALHGEDWAVRILALPEQPTTIRQRRHQLLDDVRRVAAAAEATRAANPIAEAVTSELMLLMAEAQESLDVGGWRVQVVLEAPGGGQLAGLAAVWRAAATCGTATSQHLQVATDRYASWLGRNLSVPQVPGQPGTGGFTHPFQYQTPMPSTLLARLIQPPSLEAPGYHLRRVVRFSVPQSDDQDAAHRSRQPHPPLTFGTIVRYDRPIREDLRVRTDDLAKHCLVAGMTGAGKTNTLMWLLQAADGAGVPFLVVEPAKAEYRGLLAHPTLGPRTRVFTAGDEAASPFRLNPFEVPEGINVSEHLALLRTAFTASFGMWTPLPQVLDRCLHDVYRDKGWDLTTNVNTRLGDRGRSWAAFPTLTDLVAKAADVVPMLGYEKETTSELLGALTTRLDSLRRGGKGAMLDVSTSMPFDDLLAHPTVIELEAMGDEADKAFLMGLLLIRLVEHRRIAGQAAELVHLLVLEEAHRLLATVPDRTSERESNARHHAVETFTNLISEIRAYGQGIIIADQIPTRLAPDAIKNTNLKVAHRLVAADDREALGQSMVMNEDQCLKLAVLTVGEAAIFSEGDDGPMLVRVPHAKDVLGTPPPDDVIADHMRSWRAAADLVSELFPRPFCRHSCADAPLACEVARSLVNDEAVQRVVARTALSMIEDPAALDRLWGDLVTVVRPHCPADLDESALLRSFAGHASHWFADRRGRQARWSYADTLDLADLFRQALTARVEGRQETTACDEFRARAQELLRRDVDPYPYCSQVCTQEPRTCLYRHAAADVVASGRFQANWRAADAEDRRSAEGGRARTWQVCQDAGYELIEYPETNWTSEQNALVTDAARRACLCFQQQMLADDSRKLPRTSRMVMKQVLVEADLQ